MRLLHMRNLVRLALVMITSTLGDNVAPTVKTPSGSVKGSYKTSQHGRRFESYEGIPYAQPPVGKFRFQPPQSITPWDGVLDGRKPSSRCMQYAIIYDNLANRVTGTEDCLYLNVYTHNTQRLLKQDKRELLPVIFAIHGGSFQYGSGSGFYKPDYVMNKDVVLVTINYRLGPFGFLSTEDDLVPGNMGLKDQVLALRWVSENIESFGGDPKSITLYGQSAGAASVHFHYLSPMSRGLFHRGISISGTALNCWSQAEATLEKTKKLGTMLRCPTNTNEDLMACLQNLPAKDIMEADSEFMGWLYNPDVPFGPIVEKNSSTPFLDKSPIEIIRSGKAADLPWITTIVSGEGLYTAAQFIANEELLEELNDNWETIAPHLLDYNFTIPNSQHANVAQKIREHYLGNKQINRNTSGDLVRLMGDRLYLVDAEKSVRIQAEMSKSPIRLYYFSYRGEYSLTEIFTHTKENFGVSHADDELYMFSAGEMLSSKHDLQMSDYIINLWTSFATTSIPDAGITWTPVDPTKETIQYLHIAGPNKFWIGRDVNFGDKKFWNTIPFDENHSNNFNNQ